MSIVSCTRISLAPDKVILSSHVITKELFVQWLPVSFTGACANDE